MTKRTKKKTDGEIVYKEILINTKLQFGNRGQKPSLIYRRSPLRRRRSALDCSVIEEEEEEEEEEGGGGGGEEEEEEEENKNRNAKNIITGKIMFTPTLQCHFLVFTIPVNL